MAIPKVSRIVLFGFFCLIYFYGLSTTGIITPDEPRYADIGRAMARSGDWVMPRLFGTPWYEKPALLYWMTAAGNLIHLGPELAPRLPVALLSVAFLAFFRAQVARGWNSTVADYATAILATTAGWLGYSHVGVTDIPVSVFFAVALLLAVRWLQTTPPGSVPPWLLPLSAASLGSAVLAKGLVPLVYFAPVAAVGWPRIRDWFRWPVVCAFCMVTLPWYVLVTWRSGGEFFRVFFLQHHLGRFESSALQHVQPWWFYLPSLLLLLFPWFPLAATMWNKSRATAPANLLLLGVVLFGLVVFSAAVNKLPGYVLPLLPVLSILFADGLANARSWRVPLVATAAVAGLLPLAGQVLPAALAGGLRTARIPYGWAGWAVVTAAFASFSVRLGRTQAFAAVAFLCAALFLGLEVVAFPQADRAASARPLWREHHVTCLGKVTRSMAYGLQYYAERPLPDCDVVDQGK